MSKVARNSVGGPGVAVKVRRLVLLGAAIVFLPLIPAPAVAHPPVEKPATSEQALLAAPVMIIKMRDDEPMYQPNSITIRSGQTVEWKNAGLVGHSVTDDPARASKPEDVTLPATAKPFNSGIVMPGGSFRHTFLVAGKYRYFCLSHEIDNMIGEITVQPPPPSSGPKDLSQPWRTLDRASEDSDR